LLYDTPMKAVPLLALALAMSCGKSKAPSGAAGQARILGIAHMALFVTDLGKSRAFYKDFLGFDEPYSLKRADGTDRSAFIKVNDEQYLELIAAPPKSDGRINHIAFYTDDAEALRRALVAKGAQMPSKTSKGRLGNAQWITTDPDGHHVEFVQYQPDGWTMRQKDRFIPETRISRRIAHIGVLIGGLDAATDFYGRLLGFKEIWRGGPSTKQLSWVNLRVPDGDDYLEMMLYDQLPPPDQRGGKNHVCLVVPDMARAVAMLEGRPSRKSYPRPIEPRVGVNHKRQVNLFDPDGTRIELMEPTTVDGKPAPSSTAPPPHPTGS
jgi:catechol 2,3-dioxygenase-like lactoylglutathione lyase family enzyme